MSLHAMAVGVLSWFAIALAWRHGVELFVDRYSRADPPLNTAQTFRLAFEAIVAVTAMVVAVATL